MTQTDTTAIGFPAYITIAPRPNTRFTTIQPSGDPVAVYTDEIPDGPITPDAEEHVSYEPITPGAVADAVLAFTRGEEAPSDRMWLLVHINAIEDTPPDDNTQRFLNSPQLVTDLLNHVNNTPCPEHCDTLGPHQHLTNSPFLDIRQPDGNIAGCTTHNLGDCPYHQPTREDTTNLLNLHSAALGTAHLHINNLLDAITHSRLPQVHQHINLIANTMAASTVLLQRLYDLYPDIAVQLDTK